jgi:general secretion pathway protein D
MEANPPAEEPAPDAAPGAETPKPAVAPGKAREARPAGVSPTLANGAAKPTMAGDQGLRFNFRGASLETVLNYMSQAAGFIIIMETKVEGKVDAYSHQPLTKDEAVNLLDTILGKNGYAAIRNGRTLTIVTRDEAKKRDIPVKTGSDPEFIPKTDEMVTQILPVKYANATQMTKDLLPLLPTYANMTANESGNALVITDTQADIKRMAQIVKALDTSISGISSIHVFPLRFADAKDLAAIVKELYPAQNSTGNNRGGAGGGGFPMFFGGRGGGGPGGMGGQGGGAQGSGVSEAKQAASRVAAVADERTNSLVIGAPDDLMPAIEELIKQIDTNAEEITELRVFRLKHSDPVEMADELTSLFPDETRTDTGRSSFQFRGGPFGGFGGGGGNAASSSGSSRAKKKGKVSAVADQRTASVIVSAASELMPQIAAMINQLDDDPAKKQKVFVYNLDNADVDSVSTVLQDMFQSQNSRNRTSTSQNNNPLNNRSLFNQGTGANGIGSSGSSRTGSTRGN